LIPHHLLQLGDWTWTRCVASPRLVSSPVEGDEYLGGLKVTVTEMMHVKHLNAW